MAASIKIPEVIISSHSAKKSYSWTMEDVHTGNVIQTSRAGQSSEHTLCMAGRDYLVSAAPENPLINVWHLTEPKHAKKMVVPGIVTALAVSRQGIYLVAAIDNKLHIWQTSTGNLLRVLPGHIQRVNCIKFTIDESHFISGGAEGVTLVWRLSNVLNPEISSRTNDVIQPTFTWNNHSMGVQDIYVSLLGCNCRVATVSSDHTCKLYQLSTGNLLKSFVMDTPLVSVSMDSAERFLFLGANNGNIYGITLPHCTSSSEFHYEASNENLFQLFSGHKEQVTCLSVSMDGQMLLSGSTDHCLKLWDIISHTCIKTIQREGPITNAFLRLIPSVVKNCQNKKYQVPAFEFETLKRHLYKNDENAGEDAPVPLNLQNQRLRTWDLHSQMDILEDMESADTSDNSKAQLTKEIGCVKKTNEQIYYYMVESFMETLRK